MDTYWYYVIALMGILLIIGYVGSRINQRKLDNFSDEVKESISALKTNFAKKSTFNKTYMDKNNICMVFICDDKRTVYIIKDTISGRYSYLVSKDKLEYGKPVINIVKLLDSKYKYNEEKLVYTGATVGGVTMGGFHVEGGNYSKQQYFTGKYALTCRIIESSVESYIIKEIYLNSELLGKAKENKVIKYIGEDSNHMILKHKLSSTTKKNIATAVAIGDYSLDGAYNKMMNVAYTEISLTKNECEEVKEWILSSMK